MRLIFLITFLLFTLAVKSQVLFQFQEEKVITWTYKDGDEFNGMQYNSSFWLNSFPWARYLYCSKDVSYYNETGNLQERDGILKIIAKKENITAKAIPYEPENYILKCDFKPDAKNLLEYHYTSGILFSKKKYLYGIYEIRFRVDEYPGLWPAFWLFEGKGNEEIDIFEIPGKDSGLFHVDVHCPKGCDNYKVGPLKLFRTGWGGMLNTNASWSNSYSIIAIEWQPDFIKWYINGVPTAYWKGKFPNPMSFIANLAVTGDNGSFAGDPDTTKFPATMDIDYIRVWQQQNGTSLKTDARFELSGKTSNLKISNTTVQTKKKPVYKPSQLKEPQRLVSVFRTSSTNLLIQNCGNLKSVGKVEIRNDQDKVLRTTALNSPFLNLSLSGLSKGNYKLIVQIGRIIATETIEVE